MILTTKRFICFMINTLLYTITAQTTPMAGPLPAQLAIDQAVSEALAHNLNLIAERYNVSVADARILTARLRPNPLFSMEGDHLPLAGTSFNAENGAGPAEYSVRTDFVFERGAKREHRREVAARAKTVAELQLLNAVRGLKLDVENAFIDMLLAKASLTLARENLAAFSNIVQVNEKRMKSGDLAEVELIRVQLAELQFENAVRQAELRLATARSRLQLLLGRGRAAGQFDIIGEFRRDSAPASSGELHEQAKQLRPDLLAMFRDQARSQAELRLQLAQGKVDYTIGSEFRRQQGLAGRGNSLGFFFQSSLPLFNRNQGEIERARREQLQIQARVRALQSAVESEVEIAFMQYASAQTALDRIENRMLAKARDVRQITEFSYKRGEATLIEFLDAQRAYNETIQTYNEAQAEFARSLYLIDAVTGKAVNP